jgi:hypothetical protein
MSTEPASHHASLALWRSRQETCVRFRRLVTLAYRSRLRSHVALVKSADSPEKVKAIELLSGRFGIDTARLSRREIMELAIRQLEHNERAAKRAALLSIVLMIILFSIAILSEQLGDRETPIRLEDALEPLEPGSTTREYVRSALGTPNLAGLEYPNSMSFPIAGEYLPGLLFAGLIDTFTPDLLATDPCWRAQDDCYLPLEYPRLQGERYVGDKIFVDFQYQEPSPSALVAAISIGRLSATNKATFEISDPWSMGELRRFTLGESLESQIPQKPCRSIPLGPSYDLSPNEDRPSGMLHIFCHETRHGVEPRLVAWSTGEWRDIARESTQTSLCAVKVAGILGRPDFNSLDAILDLERLSTEAPCASVWFGDLDGARIAGNFDENGVVREFGISSSVNVRLQEMLADGAANYVLDGIIIF